MAQHQQSFQLPKIPVGRRVVSIAVQLKCGEREEDWIFGNWIFLSVGNSKSPQCSMASEYSLCSRLVPESELGSKNTLLFCGSKGLLFPVPKIGMLLWGDAWQSLQELETKAPGEL